MSHYSYKSCEDISTLFKLMFLDSTVADKFSCGEKKCAYMACFGIAEFFKRELQGRIQKLDEWLENVPVAVRAQEIWDNIKTYVQAVLSQKKFTTPTSKSFKIVRDATKDILVPAKMAAFESVASQLQPFLTAFQSDNPILPFLVSRLQKVIQSLMKRFIKPDVLQQANSPIKLAKFDLSNKENYLDDKKVDVGFVAQAKIRKLLLDKKVSGLQAFQFRNEFRDFMKSVVSKLLEKTPIAYSVARNLAFLDPAEIVEDKEGSISKFKVVLKKMVEYKRVQMPDCDALVHQYTDFADKAVLAHKEVFLKFNFVKDRLDTFLAQHIASQSSLAKLWKLVKVLLVLSHGQATVERGFSVNRQVMVENLQERSFTAQRVIHDHITHIGGLKKLEVTKQLLDAASQ
ncbi:uncharacterized protein LOC116618576 [Nematostella vectensis]|uniref:uncharacterized protein LOC116618576 n=1 Tax=Nematostella vectensis TaxID=45351 RepID=UPI0020779A48|nr:uncharacterized protein LOC116618576 [Nematostella vectensis]XP_048577471.1 uncharacterized protein LOC116618576 [Nematostella vectensis]